MAGLFPFAAGVAPNFERGNLKKFLKLSIARRLWPGVGFLGNSRTEPASKNDCLHGSDFLQFSDGFCNGIMVVTNKQPIAVNVLGIDQCSRNFGVEVLHDLVLGEVAGHDGSYLETQ